MDGSGERGGHLDFLKSPVVRECEAPARFLEPLGGYPNTPPGGASPALLRLAQAPGANQSQEAIPRSAFPCSRPGGLRLGDRAPYDPEVVVLEEAGLRRWSL